MNVFGKYRGVIYLTLLLVVMPLLAYRLAISSTVELWCSHSREKVLIAELEQVDTTKRFQIETEEQIRSGRLLDKILPMIESNRITIESYTPVVSDKGSVIELHTAEIVISGGYVPIVRTIDFLETYNTGCKLISVNMKGSIERRTKQRKLTATIVMQQITKTE